jgi:hypothetical protein
MGLAALVFPGCSGTPLPGTLLGTYKVVGQPQTNSCGLAAPSPWTFDVQMSEDKGLLYWSWLDGSAPLSAPMAAGTTSVILTTTQRANVDGVDGSLGPCTMQRNDSVTIDLANGMPPPSFAGTIRYDFSVAAGGDCSDQLAASGGQYTALPCTVKYSVTASRQ